MPLALVVNERPLHTRRHGGTTIAHELLDCGSSLARLFAVRMQVRPISQPTGEVHTEMPSSQRCHLSARLKRYRGCVHAALTSNATNAKSGCCGSLPRLALPHKCGRVRVGLLKAKSTIV
jgi:hypothetical protein